ncbi:DUF11 domain-containing protein [Flagellimonas flava]|uniref:Conserved repeat domain-containing protein n=1 Tax=Flagellimonas flava TaxID=570519 RepID=A0A1M5JU62_9FLAO|nr:DUF11 domain-containing protein [Allomuricauda flava]SHG43503.1 conserved repeat domain-containing protein [Allomuricauda flava]
MKTRFNLILALLSGALLYAQDLELDVYVLPTSVLGDPILFNVTVKNKGDKPVPGVEVLVTLKSGLKFSGVSPKKSDFDVKTGIWKLGEVVPNKAKTLGIIANYAKRDDAIVIAEISASGAIDPDSTPGNGVDTNGNGMIINDKGDEDDGDAAQNGPFN